MARVVHYSRTHQLTGECAHTLNLGSEMQVQIKKNPHLFDIYGLFFFPPCTVPGPPCVKEERREKKSAEEKPIRQS